MSSNASYPSFPLRNVPASNAVGLSICALGAVILFLPLFTDKGGNA